MTFTTLTGLTLEQVITQLDAELPPDAYTKIPGAVDLTDIDPGYMRQVLNRAFGLCGLGWGYEYQPNHLELTFGEKNVLALVKQMTFWYVLIGPEGQERRQNVVSSGASENRTAAYAMKGALTSALGHAASNLGFQESVYLGQRSHATVGRKPSAKAPASMPAATPKVAPSPKANGADDPSAYVITIGTQYKGQAVKDLPPTALVWFAEKMAATTAPAQAAKTACATYLAAHPELRPA